MLSVLPVCGLTGTKALCTGADLYCATYTSIYRCIGIICTNFAPSTVDANSHSLMLGLGLTRTNIALSTVNADPRLLRVSVLHVCGLTGTKALCTGADTTLYNTTLWHTTTYKYINRKLYQQRRLLVMRSFNHIISPV